MISELPKTAKLQRQVLSAYLSNMAAEELQAEDPTLSPPLP